MPWKRQRSIHARTFGQSSLSLEFLAKSHWKVLPALPARINCRNRVRKYVQPYFNQVLPQVATMLLQFLLQIQGFQGFQDMNFTTYLQYKDIIMIACHCLTGMLLVTYMYQYTSNMYISCLINQYVHSIN